MYVVVSTDDYLAHYGVKGMKWGIRHDPEPTGKQRVASGKAAVKRRGLSDKQKKYIKVGAAVAVTALALGVAYKSGAFDRCVNVGKNAFSTKMSMGSNQLSLSQVLDDRFETISSSTDKIDSFFDTNKHHNTLLGSDSNCTGCAIADWIKEKYSKQVSASMAINIDPVSGLSSKKKFDMNDIEEAFLGAKSSSVNGSNISELKANILKKYPNGGSGVFGGTFINADGTVGKHAIKWSIEKGTVRFSDSQSASSLLKEAVSRGVSEDKAKRLIYSKLSNMPDDYLSRIIDYSSNKEIINLEEATGIAYNKLRNFVY